MADENTQNDVDVDDNEAEQLLAAADTPDDSTDSAKDRTRDADKAGGDSTDWRAEAERWKKHSRANEKTAKENAARLKKYEDEGKSESQRLQEDRDTHKSRAERAEAALKRREIAEEFAPDHATVAQIKAVAKRLSGDDDGALEADARELFELIAPEPAKSKVPARPKERLRGGGDPEESMEDSPADLVKKIPRNR